MVSIHIAMANKFIIGRVMNLIDKISQKIAAEICLHLYENVSLDVSLMFRKSDTRCELRCAQCLRCSSLFKLKSCSVLSSNDCLF